MTTSGVAHAYQTPKADSPDSAKVSSSKWNDDHAITYVKPSGLTGAVAASRYVGATASGAPVSGTFAVGDYVIDQTGKIWVCTAAGSPGTWNAIGASYPPLDRYPIDATYGDHFNGAALNGRWTRRGYTSGAETYQIGIDGTYLRIATAGRAAGDGYLQTAPAGDWTFMMSFILRNAIVTPSSSWGIACVDSSGTGVCTSFYQGPPASPMILGLNTYSTYSGTFQAIETAYPSLNNRKIWLKLRKSSNDYLGAVSFDGESWGPESAAYNRSFTVDRIGPLHGGLGPVTDSAFIDMDAFNKI